MTMSTPTEFTDLLARPLPFPEDLIEACAMRLFSELGCHLTFRETFPGRTRLSDMPLWVQHRLRDVAVQMLSVTVVACLPDPAARIGTLDDWLVNNDADA